MTSQYNGPHNLVLRHLPCSAITALGSFEVCKPYKPQTKGKVERSVGIIKYSFWPGVHFTDIDDLNEQATRWCDRLNQKVHRTTGKVPMELWVAEALTELPKD